MSAMAESNGFASRDAVAGSGLQLVTETKFMQQYRTASAAHGGGSVIAVKNAAGQIEIFTTGTDGSVWNFYPDPASSTGFRSIPTGLTVSTGKPIAVGLNNRGFLVVFAVKGLKLNYAIESPQAGPARWGSVQEARLTPPSDARTIDRVLCYNTGRALYVGVLFLTEHANARYWPLYYAIWGAVPAAFFPAPHAVSQSLCCAWSNNSPSTVEFTSFDFWHWWGYRVQANTVVWYGRLDAHIPDLASITTQIDRTSVNRYFTIMTDGNIYEYSSGWDKYEWHSITNGMSFREVTSAPDSTGAIHLFALAYNNRIWHIAPGANGTWMEPLPLRENVALMAACTDSSGAIELYLVGATQDMPMARMVRDDKTGDWRSDQIELPSLTQVEQFIAYATDVTVCNANGTPQPNTTVEVSASSVVQIAANGSVYSVGPHAPVHLRTNRAGTIAIAQPTESLGAATLSFSLPLQEPIAVRQFAGVEHDLAVVSRDKLLDARDASGAFLLPDKYRNRDTAQALADNCHACMKLVRSTAVKLNAAELKRGARKLGVGAHSRDATERLNRIVAPSEPVHWLIEFGEGTMTYRELTEARSELRNFVGGPHALLSELGDLVTAVSNGIAQVTSALITAIDNEVRAAITFVIDGVNYIIRSAITLVEEVFDLVEVVFANVMVGFEKTFEWLGFVFNWDDILRTRSVIAYAIEEFLAFLPTAAAGIKTLVDGGIANLVAQIDPAFNGLVERLGNGNLGDCFRNNQQDDPVFSSGIANNQILDATLSSGSTASIRVPAAIMGAMSGPVDDVLKKIQDFTTSVGNINEFQQAREILQNLGGDLDQILNGIAAAMLRIVQGIIKFMLQGAQPVVDGLLDLLSTLTAALLLLLKAECDVPFVSAFYQWLAKAKLTPLDLVALIVAIPTTALYKAVTKAAPFPDQASVDLFKTSYTRQVLLARFGLGPSRDVVAVARDNPPSFTFQQFLDLANVACTGTYGLLMMYPDTAAATDGTDGPAPTAVKIASIIGFAAELGAQAFSFPGSIPTGHLPDCVSSDGVKKWLWLHGLTGIALDGYFLYHDHTFPENNNTASGTVISFAWGLGRAGVYAIGCAKLNIYNQISYGVEAAVSCLKILRLPILARPPVLAALALIDSVGYFTIALTTFLDSLPPTTEGSVAVSRVVPGAVPRLGAVLETVG